MDSHARTCSPWSWSSSRLIRWTTRTSLTPATTPGSSTTTCTSPTATCTCSPTTRRSAPGRRIRCRIPVFRRLAARLGFDDPSSASTTRTCAAPRSTASPGAPQGNRLAEAPACPSASRRSRRRIPDAFAQVRVHSAWLEQQGIDPRRSTTPAEAGDAALEKTPPHSLSPPAHQLPQFHLRQRRALREFESEPHLDLHPQDAAARGIADSDMVRVFASAAATGCARASTASRAPGWSSRRRYGGRSIRRTAAATTLRRSATRPWRRRHVLRLPGASRTSVRRPREQGRRAAAARSNQDFSRCGGNP